MNLPDYFETLGVSKGGTPKQMEMEQHLEDN